MDRTDASHPLEASRQSAMDAAALAGQAKGTIVYMQTATDGSVDWMIHDALKSLADAKARIEAAERTLTTFKTQS